MIALRCGVLRPIAVFRASPAPQSQQPRPSRIGARPLHRWQMRGLLSGRMNMDTRFAGDDLRRNDPKFQLPRFAQYLHAVDRLDRLARERFGKRVIHLALRWVLDQPGVGVALWGARRPEQLAPIEGTMGWRIDDETMRDIGMVLAETIADPVGPEFMAGDRGARLRAGRGDTAFRFHGNGTCAGQRSSIAEKMRPVRVAPIAMVQAHMPTNTGTDMPCASPLASNSRIAPASL